MSILHTHTHTHTKKTYFSILHHHFYKTPTLVYLFYTKNLLFLFFNFSFSAFLPMGLYKVSPEFISSLSSTRLIELAKVWQDCVASCLVRTLTLSLRFNHLALFLKILQQCSSWNAFLLLLLYIVFASLIYKSKKLNNENHKTKSALMYNTY